MNSFHQALVTLYMLLAQFLLFNWGCNLTSVRKRLDHVLFELEHMGVEQDDEKAANVIANNNYAYAA